MNAFDKELRNAGDHNALLFSPTSFAGLRLRNRVAMSPMTRSFCASGIPGQDVADYYRRRADGGVGLIFTEGTYIAHSSAGDGSHVPRLESEATVDAWRVVTDAVHAAGTPIFSQLWHMGLSPIPGKMVDRSRRLIGPSGRDTTGAIVDRPMTAREMAAIVEAFGNSADAAKRAGFDGIEIHAGHGYMLDQFFWERTNTRTDAYGGSIENRTRFAAEIVAECRSRVGPGFPISIRISQWKMSDYEARVATTPAEMDRWLTPLVDAGIDIIHCSQRRFWEPEFAGSDLNMAGWAKKLTGKPTITVGSVTIQGEGPEHYPVPAQLERLEQMLGRGDFDLVAVGRAVLQNPGWVDMVRLGRAEELEPFDRARCREVLF